MYLQFAPPPPESIDELIGEVAAAAAISIAVGMGEWADGKLSAETKAAGADRLTELYELRRTCLLTGELDAHGPRTFEAIARLYGDDMLCRRCGNLLSERMRALLLDGVIEILDNTGRWLNQ